MLYIDTQGAVKGGVAVLLVGTVFIGLCMGFVAYNASNLLGSNPSTAQVTVTENMSDVTIEVHTLGPYNELIVTVNNSSQTITQEGEYTFSTTNSSETSRLIIEGKTSGNETETVRNETV